MLALRPGLFNSAIPSHDLSESYPQFTHQALPPGQLDLVTSHPPGQIYLSRGCQSTELRLKCSAHKVLIIESALFSPAHWNPAQFIKKLNCSSQTKHSEAVERGVVIKAGAGAKDIRQALNRRCSGYSSGEECKFSLLLDQPEARNWGEGWVEVWHKCVEQENMTTKCGKVRQTQRGYIMSKAYPKYYMGGESCTWHISVPPSQVLLLIVLDLQLRGLSSKGECDDSLTIDYQAVLCGELDKQLHYISNNGRAVVKFKTTSNSQYIYPQRGFLIEIVPLGCDPYQPSPSSNAYLVTHNRTHATYQCRRQYLFPVTLSTTTTLLCTGHTYHTPLPDCVSIQHLVTHGNTSIVNALLTNNLFTNQPQAPLWIQELFLPLLLTILTLLISISGLIILLFMKRHLSNSQQHHNQLRGSSYKYFETNHF